MSKPRLNAAMAEIARHYDRRLLGAVLFGSRAGPRPRVDSDWDLLLVLTDSEAIRRSLYREWDNEVAARVDAIVTGISPHFVHLPADQDEPSSLWLEVAMAHEVLSDTNGRLSSHLLRVRALIEAGRFERRTTHGLPYWRSAR